MEKRLFRYKPAFFLLLALMFLTPLSVMSEEDRITISFYQSELSGVLQVLSRETGVQMVPSSGLGDMKISAYLKDVKGVEAIDSILSANNLYREKVEGSNIYIVKQSQPAPPKPPQPVRLASHTFNLQYGRAEDLKESIESLLGPDGRLIQDARTNSITVMDTGERISLLKDIIAALDRSAPQVSIEAVLVELTEDGLKDLGIRWNIQGRFFGPSLDTSFPWQRSYTRDILGSGGVTSADPSFILGNISFANLEANLRILQEKGKANILANPRITALNDEEAEIRITRNMAIAPKVTETDDARRVVTEYEYRDVGVTLKVVPRINAEGFITLAVEPSVSSAAPSGVFPDAVDTYERTAKTSVMIKDGETLVIGGLLRQDTTERVSKVPLLGDILPFIFSRKDTRSEQTDLVIFLTPRIVTQDRAKALADEEKARMLGE